MTDTLDSKQSSTKLMDSLEAFYLSLPLEILDKSAEWTMKMYWLWICTAMSSHAKMSRQPKPAKTASHT